MGITFDEEGNEFFLDKIHGERGVPLQITSSPLKYL